MSNLLVIDKDPAIQSVFDFILSQRGYSVSTGSLDSSLSLAKSKNPSIIFQDLSTAPSASLGIIKSYLKLNINCIVVGLIDYSKSNLLANAYNQGIYCVVFKPFDAEEVVSVVSHIEKRVLIDE